MSAGVVPYLEEAWHNVRRLRAWAARRARVIGELGAGVREAQKSWGCAGATWADSLGGCARQASGGCGEGKMGLTGGTGASLGEQTVCANRVGPCDRGKERTRGQQRR
jgi:hypothetical protein